MKVFELLINELDEITGVDAVALVNQPAIESNFFAFKQDDIGDSILYNLIKFAIKEQMVERLPGESRDDYLGRCIPQLISEGYDEDQAAAICYDTFKFDETEDVHELVIGDYQTRHYDMCPGASELYKKIESQEIDTDMGLAIRNAKLQDALFYAEKVAIKKGSATFDDVKQAEILAGEIMHLARMMGLEEEHQYVLGHLQVIRDLYAIQDELDVDVTGLPNYVNEIKEEQKFSFSIHDDQQMVVGPLMIPNKLIVRVNEEGEPYYVYFSKETIEQIAQKMMREKYIDQLNLEHNPDEPVDGYMVSTWIVEDVEKDKQQVYGFNLPVGTWMGQYKIKDQKVWQKVKNGEIKGFSIEGFFGDRFVQAKAIK